AQLRLYGLYKIATEGPCTAPQPSALKLKARAKW
uniref:ACB domain-containing protein n=2 Tax=Poaceae TaxID=4479 RepID=A0A453DH72_AEGTS